MPFNTLLWRVVAMTPDGFVEGERSLGGRPWPHGCSNAYASDTEALVAVQGYPRRAATAMVHPWFHEGRTTQRTNWCSRTYAWAPSPITPSASPWRRGDGGAWREIPAQTVALALAGDAPFGRDVAADLARTDASIRLDHSRYRGSRIPLDRTSRSMTCMTNTAPMA